MKTLVLALALAVTAALPRGAEAKAADPSVVTKEATTKAPKIPDVPLFDQNGKQVRLPELIRGKTVAINFVFTTCSTVCSPLTAIFSRVQGELGAKLGKDVHLLSITLDPGVDTPERLNEYASMFGRQEGWTFVTGKPEDVRMALKAFGAHVAKKEEHTPMVLIGNEPAGKWTRLFGLSSPARIVEEVGAIQSKKQAPPVAETASLAESAAKYFTDLEVVDQNGKTHRFYSDLIKDRKVLIHFAFSSCKAACPPILGHMAKVQKELGARMGKEIRILTLSVDPENDTPRALKAVATDLKAGPGWYFLTGTHKNMKAILERLGGWTDNPDAHSSVLYLGDASTGHWIKTMAMRSSEEIAHALVHLNDPEPVAPVEAQR